MSARVELTEGAAVMTAAGPAVVVGVAPMGYVVQSPLGSERTIRYSDLEPARVISHKKVADGHIVDLGQDREGDGDVAVVADTSRGGMSDPCAVKAPPAPGPSTTRTDVPTPSEVRTRSPTFGIVTADFLTCAVPSPGDSIKHRRNHTGEEVTVAPQAGLPKCRGEYHVARWLVHHDGSAPQFFSSDHRGGHGDVGISRLRQEQNRAGWRVNRRCSDRHGLLRAGQFDLCPGLATGTGQLLQPPRFLDRESDIGGEPAPCVFVRGRDESNLGPGAVGGECVPQVATVRGFSPAFIHDVCIIDQPPIASLCSDQSSIGCSIRVRPSLGEEVRDERTVRSCAVWCWVPEHRSPVN